MSRRGTSGPASRARRLTARLRQEPLARRLAASTVFDAEFYGAQVGRRFGSALAAARHFIASGASGRHSPHPLISLAYVPREIRESWRNGGAAGLLAWFGSSTCAGCPWGPYFDPRALPPSRTAIGDPRAYLGRLDAQTRLPVHDSLGQVTVTWAEARQRALDAARAVRSRIGTGPTGPKAAEPAARPGSGRAEPEDSPHREWVEAERGLIDWDAAASGVSTRVAGRVSVVIPSFDDCKLTVGAVRALIEHTSGRDLEIIVVDNGSRQWLALGLATACAAYPGTTVVHLDRNYNFAIGSNYGAARSTGEYILFLNNDTRVRPGWLEPLVGCLDDSGVLGVQPVLVFPDETIQSAGIAFLAADYLPCGLLAGHPVEDAWAVRGHRFAAVTAAALLMRATDVIATRGFDPVFVNGSEDIDLCLRTAALRPGWFAVEPDSVIEHRESQTPGRSTHIPENRRVFVERWRGRFPGPDGAVFERLGLEVAQLRPDGALHPAALPVVVRPRVPTGTDGRPRLRWSVKNPATGSWYGPRWGDTRFIADLAVALTDLGQEVVSYHNPSYAAPATALDDVNLVVRGVRRIAPHPGQTNVLWVISHPESVTRDEVLGFDLVYAASPGWAERTSTAWGVPVRPLLQAADTRLFQPPEEAVAPSDEAGVVFVGQTRLEEPRKIVMDAIEAGLRPLVWGENWARFIPQECIQGDYLPKEQLPGVYRNARVVLADHHRDMAEHGFVANRIFDAVASGARVVSDEVPGLADLFGGAVQVYRSVDDLARLASPEGAAQAFPGPRELREIARRVAAEHSFAARAATLLKDVLELRRS